MKVNSKYMEFDARGKNGPVIVHWYLDKKAPFDNWGLIHKKMWLRFIP